MFKRKTTKKKRAVKNSTGENNTKENKQDIIFKKRLLKILNLIKM